MFKLIIGNYNDSSWSLRPWLAARQASLPFEEIPLQQPTTRAEILKYSPSGKLPCLIDGDTVVWDSLSICEYLSEKAPLWPSDAKARAEARSIACEMHSGFSGLRQAMPFDVRASRSFSALPSEAAADAARIIAICQDCRQRHGQKGPFLFGDFSNADAMFAPLVFRFQTYHVDLPEASRQWLETMAALPAMQEWRQAAIAEAG